MNSVNSGGEVLESVRQLAETGAVEILEETFYHSLSSLFEDKTEFIEEVKEHREMVSDLLELNLRYLETQNFSTITA